MPLAIEHIVRLVAGQTRFRPMSPPKHDACWFGDGDRELHVTAGTHWVQLVRRVRGAALEHDAMLVESLRMYMAKFALDDAGRVLLRVEVPQASLDGEYLSRALVALDRAESSPLRPSPLSSGGPPIGHEMIPPDELYLFVRTLAHEGWIVKDHVGENHWYMGYRAAGRAFRVDLGFNHAWAYFQIALRPTEFAISGTSRHHLLHYLLRLNDVLYWVKLGLGGIDQVVLTLDLPIEMFDLERLRLAARTLARYAVTTSTEVQLLSTLDTESELRGLLDERSALRSARVRPRYMHQMNTDPVS